MARATEIAAARRAVGGAASVVVQYALAYGVGVPVFVLYRIGRKLRRRPERGVSSRAP
jgi:hypothetical protein